MYTVQVATFQSLPNSPTFPGISHRVINIIKPLREVYRESYCTPEWILWHYWLSILCMSTSLNSTQVMFILWLSQLRYHTMGKPQFPWHFLISLTNVRFPDFSRLSRQRVNQYFTWTASRFLQILQTLLPSCEQLGSPTVTIIKLYRDWIYTCRSKSIKLWHDTNPHIGDTVETYCTV